MASTPLGDIIGARFHESQTAAAIASGGANGTQAAFGPWLHNIKVQALYFTPLSSGGIAATQTATYRQGSLINPGTSGTLTITAASINYSYATNATVASFVPTGGTVSTVATRASVASGTMLYVTQATVGGTDANGTVLPAGVYTLAFEVV